MSEPTVRGLIHLEIKEAIDLPDTDGFFAGATDAYVKVSDVVWLQWTYIKTMVTKNV